MSTTTPTSEVSTASELPSHIVSDVEYTGVWYFRCLDCGRENLRENDILHREDCPHA